MYWSVVLKVPTAERFHRLLLMQASRLREVSYRLPRRRWNRYLTFWAETDHIDGLCVFHQGGEVCGPAIFAINPPKSHVVVTA